MDSFSEACYYHNVNNLVSLDHNICGNIMELEALLPSENLGYQKAVQ